ncbi:MAG: hypothetical protein K8I27_00245 [Planctomycetes bacterium]|nr:hypothetical protein [Planctomycetota bacterium]
MKATVAMMCVSLGLLVSGSVVIGGTSVPVEEYGDANVDGGVAGFLYVEHVPGDICRTWGDGTWSDTDDPFNLVQEARDVEEHLGTIESTQPRWDVTVAYSFELYARVGVGSDKGMAQGTPRGMVWGDIRGADGYTLLKDLDLTDDETGLTAVSYQAKPKKPDVFPDSPVNWFY